MGGFAGARRHENIPEKTYLCTEKINKRMKRNLFFLLCVVVALSACTQTKNKATDENRRRVAAFFDSVDEGLSPNELMIRAALFFKETPYVAQTLEGNGVEQLVVNLHELDCMTLVENCLALSRAAQSPDPEFSDFLAELQRIRYRAGVIDGYTSRLHYTTDWITDNSALGILEDRTGALGGLPFHPEVGYMSAHPDRYPALKDNPQNTEVMRQREQVINAREDYRYLPKEQIAAKESQIESGDIIGFTTRLPGLDIAHVAIAYRQNGQLTFIHASTQFGKVVVQPESLAAYCQSIKTHTGIVVLRPRGI
jgi:hypothetical protein